MKELNSLSDKEYEKFLLETFDKQSDVPFRDLKLSKERYEYLACVSCRTNDRRELDDFAFISTHPIIRQYYLRDTNIPLIESIELLSKKMSRINPSIEQAGKSLSDFNSSYHNFLSTYNLQSHRKRRFPLHAIFFLFFEAIKLILLLLLLL